MSQGASRTHLSHGSHEKGNRVTGLLNLKANGGDEWAKGSRAESARGWCIYTLIYSPSPILISPFACFHCCCCSHCSHPCRCHHHHQQGLMTTNSSYKYPARESGSCSAVSDSLRPHGLYSPWNSPGQNTGAGSLSLLQGIFPTQGSNPGLPHCRRILYQLSHRGNIVRYPSKGTVITDILAVLLLCCSTRKCTAWQCLSSSVGNMYHTLSLCDQRV